MSLISSPWIEHSILKILSDNKIQRLTKAKSVQVTKVYDSNTIEVSDAESTITLILGQGQIIPCNSIIKIQEIHFSTVICSKNPEKIPMLLHAGVTMPFALRCNKAVIFGGDDCIILGNPSDINLKKSIRAVLENKNATLPLYKHGLLTKQLASVQFPDEDCLPNAGIL